jgi:hypothetical protein
MESERSKGSLVMALVVVGLLSWSLFFPWYSYDYSSGRRTPPGGPQEENDTRVIKHEIDFYPDSWQGDIEPSDASAAQDYVARIHWSVWVALVAAILVAVGELPYAARVLVRPVSLSLYGLSFAAIGFALYVTWYQLPDTMSGYGVTGAWTYFLQEPDGYTRTNIARGWAAAAIALGFLIAGFLFKFQAGDTDSTSVEQYRKKEAA